MLRFRSVNSIVIAPAKTGSDSKRRIAVIFTDHTNRGTLSSRYPFGRILMTVEIKLIDARIEEIPARWSEKMAKSTEGPA